MQLKQSISGPDRKYPKKTFNSGEDGATNTVLGELLEMPNYLDYSVFSKNQLRFAEKVFKTDAYIKNEKHIRGKNMFLKLNKPQYWNKTNIYLLFDSIGIVFDIVAEVLTEAYNMKINSNSKISDLAKSTKEVLDGFVNYFVHLRRGIEANKDIIGFLKQYTAPDSLATLILNSKGNAYIAGTHILAMGIILATYAKVVSILTYVNPYVLVRKDSGVDTIKAPKIIYDAVTVPGGIKINYKNKSAYENFEANVNNVDIDGTIRTKPMKTLNIHTTTETGTKTNTSKTYSKNPLIRLNQFPMYSLDIIFPLKIAPYIITMGKNFNEFYKNIIPWIIPVKLICSVLKISFESVISKFNTCDNDTKLRIKPSYSIKIINHEKRLQVKLQYSRTPINTRYILDVIANCTSHPYVLGSLVTEQNGSFGVRLSLIPIPEKYPYNNEARQEAINKQIKTNTNYNDSVDPKYRLTDKNINYKQPKNDEIKMEQEDSETEQEDSETEEE